MSVSVRLLRFSLTVSFMLVVADGFEYEGQRYRSLSAVAKAVTGSHINGFTFFRLWGDK